jgi:hypothetical protein
VRKISNQISALYSTESKSTAEDRVSEALQANGKTMKGYLQCTLLSSSSSLASLRSSGLYVLFVSRSQLVSSCGPSSLPGMASCWFDRDQLLAS